MKKALLLLLFLPIAFSFDCKNLDQQFCSSVISSNLTQSDKDTLLAVGLLKNPDLPDHQFVEIWNTNLAFNQAPDGVSVTDRGTIRDAWFKIIAVMPSVIDGRLLSPGYGKIQTALNYRIQMPTGTMPGDCSTSYSLSENTSVTTIYLNSANMGRGNLVSFNTSKDMNFLAQLNLKSVIQNVHYQTEKYCCSTYRGRCRKYCYRCSYHHTDYTTDELQLQDTIKAIYYNPNPSVDLNIFNNYYQTSSGNLKAANVISFSLESDNAYLRKYLYDYGFNYSLFPYYALTLQAFPHEKQQSQNINAIKVNNSYDITIKESNSCLLKYNIHFQNYSKRCNLSYVPVKIEIFTDKLSYLENESILVNVSPKNILMQLIYGNLTIGIKNNVSIIAKFPDNKITVFVNGTNSEKIFAVRKKDSLDFFVNLGVFSGICYFSYALIKKHFGVLL